MRFILLTFMIIAGGCALLFLTKYMIMAIVEVFGEPVKQTKPQNTKNKKEKTNEKQ